MTHEPTEEWNARVRSAVLAFVKQELSAPVATILGYAEMLLEDANRQQLAEFDDDLRRIHAAGRQLDGFIGRLTHAALAEQGTFTSDELKSRLRHDLRTPINAVKGYAEMILEVAEDRGFEQFAADLRKLIAASTALLGRIEEVVTLDAAPAAGQAPSANLLGGLERLKDSALAEVTPALRPRAAIDPMANRVGASRVLVADDNGANRDLLCRRLVRDGHRVTAAEDGVEALAAARAQEFDLILLDLMMPRLSGYEVLVQLKAAERTANLPVIMISALDETDSVVRCIEAGAEDYLPKPWDPVILRARVNACLEKKRLRDRELQFLDEIRTAQQKAESLLLNILPRSVIRRLNRGETVIADRYPEATLLFADIVGFTRLSSGLPALQLVEVLNVVFSEFDRIAFDLGVEKIKTIGDAYMAVAGLPEPAADHAFRIATMALRMVEAMREARRRLDGNLHIRIGIHTGPVVAGIIGAHKFAYDVWGDTVNVASRMETHGLPGEIQASEQTFARLRHAFIWLPRGPIEVKGKGPMTTYLLRGAKSRQAASP